MKYLLVVLLAAGCVRNASFDHDKPAENKTTSFRPGDCVMVVDGYYSGCRGHVHRVINNKAHIEFYGECYRVGYRRIKTSSLVLLSNKGGY